MSDPETNYINAEKGLWSWLTTSDHKRIGVMYLVSILIAFSLGGVFALLLRIKLLFAGNFFIGAKTYNQFFTLHGAIMVFLFIIPSIPGAMANFVLPIMIGAKDVAFPRLNLASLYIYWAGAIIVLGAIILGGVDTGWTFYVPYSSTSTFSPSHISSCLPKSPLNVGPTLAVPSIEWQLSQVLDA